MKLTMRLIPSSSGWGTISTSTSRGGLHRMRNRVDRRRAAERGPDECKGLIKLCDNRLEIGNAVI